jgi:hypothetical protein
MMLWPDHLLLGLTILLVVIIGLLDTYIRYVKLKDAVDTLSRFAREFMDWCDQGFEDRAHYMTIVSQSPKIQRMMGTWGLVEYQKPLSKQIQRQWPVILNAIPIVNQYSNNGMGSGIADIHINLVNEALARASGDLTSRMEDVKSSAFNPLLMFRSGMDFILSQPMVILKELGLISRGAFDRITQSLMFRAVGLALATVIFVLALGTPARFERLMATWSDILLRLNA